MITSNENGFFSFGVLFTIFSFSFFLLIFYEKQISIHQNFVFSEANYLQNYHLAYSSLNYGLQHKWDKFSKDWQCFSNPQNQLFVCAKNHTINPFIILKGDSSNISLYFVVEFDEEKRILNAKNRLFLDYCPEKDEKKCLY